MSRAPAGGSPRAELEAAIARAMTADQPTLRRRLGRLGSGAGAQALEDLATAVARSVARREARAARRPAVTYPEDLPIAARRQAVMDALAAHQVVVVCGETGSGKSTQLPKICLDLGRGAAGYIGHTQPRRIAARAIARRIAEELGQEVGAAVGYKVRFQDRISAESLVKVMTDGVLLAEIAADRELRAYDTLIIDEAHERSLNIDFLLGYLKKLLPRRPELKLIITSATIDPERLSRHFGNAPVIEVSGRLYPVELRHRPLVSEDPDRRDLTLQQGILAAVDELAAEGPGDVLVFLPGEREIREAAEALRKHHPPHTEILPLYARLSAAEQDRVFRPHGGRRVVLATNVAETSLTVPGIRYVVDSGLARVSRYSARSKVQRLPVEPVSQASARQRAGRCGRLADGICVRLYSEEDLLGRPAFTDPEVLRTNLAAVILRLEELRLGAVEAFPFVDPPEGRYISDGYRLLRELGAVDEARRLTPLGRQLARLPLDPRIGRMVLAGRDHGCLAAVLVIAAALSAQDPRERPLEFQQQADEAHGAFADPRSDFLWYLKLWQVYQEQLRHLSQNKLRGFCRRHFLSYMRMREWADIHAQLIGLMHDMGFRTGEAAVDYEPLHRALLAGLLGQVAVKEDGGEYLGPRGVRLGLFPGSALFAKGPKWIMAAEFAETRRLFARTVAKVEPEWVLQAAGHLVSRSHAEPHWEPRSGRVMAFETVTLYGLTLSSRRRVDYSRIDPRECRRLFIRDALVEGEYRSDAPFLRHYRALLAAVREREHRIRRLDILADEDSRWRFFDERLGPEVVDARSFERWRKRAEAGDPRLLFMEQSQVVRADAPPVPADAYPDALHWSGLELALEYRFQPGAEEDGITVRIPLAVLAQLEAAPFEWLVPGLLGEKIEALIRSLPKAQRRLLVPVPDSARHCLETMARRGPLLPALAACLSARAGTQVSAEDFRPQTLEAHLFMRFAVVDEDGRVLAAGRDLERLREALGERAQRAFRRVPAWRMEIEGRRSWDFGPLPGRVESAGHGLTLHGYPALVDEGGSVGVRVHDRPEVAAESHRRGLRRLIMLALPEQMRHLRAHLKGIQTLCLQFRAVGDCETLKSDLMAAIVDAAFLEGSPEIRSRKAFEGCIEAGRGKMMEEAEGVCALAARILDLHHQIARRLSGAVSPARLAALADVREQLSYLVYPGFLAATPASRRRHLPRYLQGILRRLEKLEREPAKDRERALPVLELWQHCKARLPAPGQGIADPELAELRWGLEELRISAFAQELGTSVPVSASRLRRQWQALGRTPA